jgi:GxxExxY protein
MVIELHKHDLHVEKEKPLKVNYDNQVVGNFYVNLVVEDEISVELKSVQNLTKAHACPVKLRSTVHEVNLFNWGGSISRLSQWIK